MCRQSLKCSEVKRKGPAAICNQSLGEKEKKSFKFIVGALNEMCYICVSYHCCSNFEWMSGKVFLSVLRAVQ